MQKGPGKIVTWVRLDKRFIEQDNIRSIKREGAGTKISLIMGSDILVNVDFDKVKALIPSLK